MKSTYHVYILASRSRVLYVGVTSNLRARLKQHRALSRKHFTGRYNIRHLVYVEALRNVDEAIRREKQIKSWPREKKELLIKYLNPEWQDLSDLV